MVDNKNKYLPPIVEDERRAFCNEQSNYVGDHIVPLFTWIRPKENTEIYIEQRVSPSAESIATSVTSRGSSWEPVKRCLPLKLNAQTIDPQLWTENKCVQKIKKQIKELEKKFKSENMHTKEFIKKQWEKYKEDPRNKDDEDYFENADYDFFSSDDDDNGIILSFLEDYDSFADKDLFEKFLKFVLVLKNLGAQKEILFNLLMEYTENIENDDEQMDFKDMWILIIKFWYEYIPTSRQSIQGKNMTTTSPGGSTRDHPKRKASSGEFHDDGGSTSERKKRRPSPPPYKSSIFSNIESS